MSVCVCVRPIASTAMPQPFVFFYRVVTEFSVEPGQKRLHDDNNNRRRGDQVNEEKRNSVKTKTKLGTSDCLPKQHRN